MQALQRVFHSGETSEHMADNDMKSSAAASSKANQLPLARDVRCTTSDVKPLRETSFESFGLKRELLLGIHEMGFEMPSPVQEKAIPEALKGRHVLARAKNGTGKTAAFMIPVLQKIDTSVCVPHKPQAIILVPTRELALQTSSICMALGKTMKVRVMVATGGTELHEDIMRIMQGVHVIVATPGRLLELLTPKKVWKDNVMFGEYCIIEPSQCKIAVLDEADKLLSADFAPLINDILGRLPADRQILLFSATFPVTIASFKDHLKPAPVVINLMNELTLKGITEFYVYLDEKNKVHCLNTLFRKLEISQAIIFVNSSRRAAILARKIFELGYSCYYIHSRMNQDFRNRIFHDFRHGTVRNLVCTDLFTRGIDVAAVNVVVNFDFPRMSETYLHRIGRSGRFGHLGIAINMVTDDDKDNLLRIERELNTQIRPIPKEIERSLYVGSCQPNNVSGEEILAKAMKKMTLDHQDGGAGCGADADKSGAHGQMKTEMVA